MPFEVLNAEQQAARDIRMYFGVLQRYRNTSMAIHNRHVEAVNGLAIELRLKVQDIAADFEGSDLVERWVHKFDEYLTQHGLL